MSTAGTGMEAITFPPNIPVTTGEYVLYATVSHDYVVAVTDVGNWAIASVDPYAGGAFVYMNNGNDVGALTTTAWTVWNGTADAGFTVVFAAPPVVVPPAPVAVPVVVAPAFTG